MTINYQTFAKNSFSLEEKDILHKIIIEKRKRSQTYTTLEYILSNTSYFDFFSYDSFQITKQAKFLAQSFKLEQVTPELFIFPFLESNLEISSFLKSSNLTMASLKNLLPKSKKNIFFSWQERIFLNLGLSNFPKKFKFDNTIQYSHESNLILEAAADNALNRFKTPVITPEILFITIMENKTNKVAKQISKIVSNQMNWYLLRYRLIKRIHSHELSIRNQVTKNEQYFAYLLKTRLPEIEFDRLIENDLLSLGILFFRNMFLSEVLKIDLSNSIKNEIYNSIKATNYRKYSS